MELHHANPLLLRPTSITEYGIRHPRFHPCRHRTCTTPYPVDGDRSSGGTITTTEVSTGGCTLDPRLITRSSIRTRNTLDYICSVLHSRCITTTSSSIIVTVDPSPTHTCTHTHRHTHTHTPTPRHTLDHSHALAHTLTHSRTPTWMVPALTGLFSSTTPSPVTIVPSPVLPPPPLTPRRLSVASIISH
jgi:hypothetical protein